MELREDSLTEFPVDGGPRIRAANRSQGKAHGGPGPDQGQPLDGQGQSLGDKGQDQGQPLGGQGQDQGQLMGDQGPPLGRQGQA